LNLASAHSGLTVGIDIGGTKVLGGVVDTDGNILGSFRKDTPKTGGQDLINVIIDVIKELQKSHEITGIGVSTAGIVSSDRKTVIAAGNIANWNNVSLADALIKEFGLPAVVENDANAAIWAEYKFGNAKNLNPVMFFIIGTGMGGGLIIDGKLYRGAHGIGAEFGHMMVKLDGERCGCGAIGCIETYASGSALMRYAHEEISANPEAGKALLAFGDGTLHGFTGQALNKAAQNGNPLALTAFNKQADWVGSAIASYTLLLDPEAIIIGGGVIDAGDIFLKPAIAAAEKYMPFAGKHPLPKIIAAKFGNDAGLVGAADLVRA
jgi:glucokinase